MWREKAAEVRHVPESFTMEPTQDVMETPARDLGALLGAWDGEVVTLLADGTRLVAHRTVLGERSPVFGGMFRHDSLEANAGEVAVQDLEGPVLRQLIAYLYTLQAPQLPSLVPQLLAADDKYGVSALKARCEQVVAAQLSVETAAATAVLAIRHSCTSLRQAAVNFIKANVTQVMTIQGWADAEKNSRLIQAAKEDSVTGLQMLLAADADVGANEESEDRGTTLHWAANKGHAKAARCLVKGGADVDARAAYYGHEAVARLLLEAGAEVDATNKTQSTPLLLAAVKEHTAVVRLLLASTPYRSARKQWGRTPLHEVALNGHAEVTSALLEAGAGQTTRDNQGKTPLQIAR
ncbi:ankyrin repeat and protein kinase domain-containing protein 1-like [Schistocerca gregaria]|uniref:ankyrin repeat and protein kinase domain-containing protein 1-like n=1 Tax=Schistocerca gregaria TaxID=7010 RepID=UPI00211E5ED1|nr:ankyrin repeat and protein kinase domain-containing protein 1-like [Schistocerca gregaria]